MTLKRMVAMSWDVVVAVAAAITAALWLPPITLKELTTELIAFFTIQSAIILPAMIFTAGVLRGDGLTLSEVDRYHSALRRQMHFWTTLLFLDLLAAGVVIIGKAADWRWKVTVWHWSHDLGWALIAITAFLITLAVLRMIPFVRGVMSLLDLNAWLAKKSIEGSQYEATPTAAGPLRPPFEPPEGYGRVVNQKRRRH
jgi:hypothetical protein